mmetsp:Transcript_12383/g.50771  ORF Transcript_12383/g.50771 Transcript_12383/m.50771 type:complete len:99 (+) Transcript_12383:442-738(+)
MQGLVADRPISQCILNGTDDGMLTIQTGFHLPHQIRPSICCISLQALPQLCGLRSLLAAASEKTRTTRVKIQNWSTIEGLAGERRILCLRDLEFNHIA